MTYVKNLTSPKGNKITNQFVIYDTNGNVVFQSSKSTICAWDGVQLSLAGNIWDCSATIRKYFKQFITNETPFVYENKADWLKQIKNNKHIKVV